MAEMIFLKIKFAVPRTDQNGSNRNCPTLLKNGTATLERSWHFLANLNIYLHMSQEFHPRGMKIYFHCNTGIERFTVDFFILARKKHSNVFQPLDGYTNYAIATQLSNEKKHTLETCDNMHASQMHC